MTKSIAVALALLVASTHALALNKGELNARIGKLGSQLESLQKRSEGAIPTDKLKAAKGIILMERTKGGFIIGYEQGHGVAMVRNQDGQWSAPSFMISHEGSFGAQIGGKSSFIVILLMHDSATDRLLSSEFKFGGEAAGTAGDSSGSTTKNESEQQPVLVFGFSSGVYGGATVQAGSVDTDEKANTTYYGDYFSSKEILFEGKVETSERAKQLAETINKLADN